MKKVLFLMLALAVGMTSAFAQVKPNFKAFKKSDAYKTSVSAKVQDLKGREAAPASFAPTEAITRAAVHHAAKGFDEWETMETFYDLQSNGALGNRIAVWPDGTAAVVATWGNDGSGYTNRGTGYNYYDGSDFGDMPEASVEDPLYSGWPSIAPLGNGEILASHGNNNTNVFKRTVKGEGAWEDVHTFTGWTWPRVATTHNGQYVHAIFADQDASNSLLNYVNYSRSTDGGATWSEPANPPMVDVEGMYHNGIGADDYVMAVNGDRIAILFAGCFYDLFYIYSEDNGETWTKQIIYNYPYDHAIDWGTWTPGPSSPYNSATDSIWAVDNSASIAIDNNGTVHVAFGLIRVAPSNDASAAAGSYSYWPFTDGIVYWNSEYENEKGGHEILPFGEWSGDAQLIADDPTWTLNGTNGISNTMRDERIWALAEEDGFDHLNLIQPDENHNGELDYLNDIWTNNWGAYRSLGIATMPAISIDEHGNMIIAYSAISEKRTGFLPSGKEMYLRSGMITVRDATGDWFYDTINLSALYEHSSDEVYPITANSQGSNKEFWLYYSADDEMGLVLDYNTGDDAQSTVTTNAIYAVRVNTSEFVNTTEVVNPMTAARVYPNPATTTLNIEVNASQNSDVNMCVYNIMGQKVAEKNGTINTGINTLDINTSELSSGVYFVTVKANGFDKTMKFVVK